MGNLWPAPYPPPPVPDWDAILRRPEQLGPLLAHRMRVTLPWDVCWAEQLHRLKATTESLGWRWDAVYCQCSSVERIQLFRGEWDAVFDEWLHLFSSCQEPWRMRVLRERLWAAGSDGDEPADRTFWG